MHDDNKQIFLEILEEASKGKVILGEDELNLNFNSPFFKRNEKTDLFLSVNDGIFFHYLDAYIKKALIHYSDSYVLEEQNTYLKKKTLMASLLLKASIEDFSNPIEMIRKNIGFLNNSVEQINTKNINFSTECNLKTIVTKCDIFHESNFVFIPRLENEMYYYELPHIGFSISGGSAYVSSIQNKNIKCDSKFFKKVKRSLYKIQKGIADLESQEYLNYLDDPDIYYPENITDVSPSAILSIYIFVNYLKKEGINNIKVVDYLPLKWQIKYNSGINTEELERIQYNMTNKFLRSFRRAEKHIDGFEITSFPSFGYSTLEINLNSSKTKKISNPILDNLYK